MGIFSGSGLLRIAATAVGGVAGFFAGGPVGAVAGAQLGLSIGTLVTPKTVNAPRLGDLSVQNSGYGVPIPIVYGAYRLSGNVIWSKKITEKSKKKKKKLFGGLSAGAITAISGGLVPGINPTISKTRIFTYFASFAVGLCDREIHQVRRIWADGKLIYDRRLQMAGESGSAYAARMLEATRLEAFFTVYRGTETQLPDPTIVAADGADQTPAYRGLAYVVFNELPLVTFGNRRPSLEFEVSLDGSTQVLLGGDSAGWRYLQVELENQTDYSSVAFDDRAWSAGALPFGTDHARGDAVAQGYPLYADTAWTGVTAIWGRRRVTLTNLDSLFVEVIIDNDVALYVNGAMVADVGQDIGIGVYRYAASGLFTLGVNLIAFRARNRGGPAYVSLKLLRVIGTSTLYLDEVVGDLCHRAGLTPERYDVTPLGQIPIDGFAVTRTGTVRDALTPLASFGAFDAVESDGAMRFRVRGGAPVVTLAYKDLAAHEAGAQRPSAFSQTRAQEAELPRSLSITYANRDNDYQVGEQAAARVVTRATDAAQIELPIVMTSSKAKELANRSLYALWAERNTVKLTLAPRHFVLDAADPFSVDLEGRRRRLRIQSVDFALNGPVSIQAVSEDPGYYNGNLALDAGGDLAIAPLPGASVAPAQGSVLDNARGDTVVIVLDIPLLDLADDGPGYYVALSGTTGGWPGATLYGSANGGATYEEIADGVLSATAGTVRAVLPAGPSTVIDGGNVLQVMLGYGQTLTSIADADFDQLGNLAAVGAPGRWELLQFQRAELQPDGSYRLTGLARGRHGTERFIGTSQANDLFVLLDAAVIAVPTTIDFLGVPIQYRAVTEGDDPDTVSSSAATWSGEQLRPLSPVAATASRAADGSITVTWSRRSRYGTELPGGDEIPLGEASEAYEVEVLAGAAVKRTFPVTAPSVNYSAANQIADFGSPQASISFRIYQLSAAIGRGHVYEVTL